MPKRETKLENYGAIMAHLGKFKGADDTKAWFNLALQVALVVVSHWAFYAADIPAQHVLVQWAYILTRAMIWVRQFIIFHDCTHKSYFTSKKMNEYVGMALGGFIGTPYKFWRDGHVHHHGILGNKTIRDKSRTVFFSKQEYEAMPLWKRFLARVLRDPFVFFPTIPIAMFAIEYRFRTASKKWWLAHSHTLILAGWVYTLLFVIPEFFALEKYAWVLGSAIGVLLFHWQHQVNLGYWVPDQDFDREEAAVKGSTYVDVPFFLKWGTMGIEYHHIHHLSTIVSCYNLQACHEDAPEQLWKDVNHVGYKRMLVSAFNTLWDEDTRKFEAFQPYKFIFETLGMTDEPEKIPDFHERFLAEKKGAKKAGGSRSRSRSPASKRKTA